MLYPLLLILLLALGVPCAGAGALACINEPPTPGCACISSWTGLDPGFGAQASLQVLVDVSNGNVRTSFAAGGRFPRQGGLRFTHNSRDSRTYPTGVGLTHTYNVMLLEHPDEWPATPVRIVLSNGYRVDFDRNLDGTYRGAPGVFSVLSREVDGAYTLRTNDSPDMIDDGERAFTFGPPDSTGRARLRSVTDSDGVMGFHYVQSGLAAGELERVVEEGTGQSINLAYDAQGRLCTVTSLDGVVTTLHYDSGGRLNSVTSSWGTLAFGHDEQHNITSINDGLGGHAAQIAYIGSARAREFRDNEGQIHDFSYTTGSRDEVLSTTFGLRGAAPEVYEIAAVGLVASILRPGQSKTCYTYSADKCLLSQTQCALVQGK